jgi:transposase
VLTSLPSVSIYVATQSVDARESFDGPCALVESSFGLDPLSGHLFVFVNRRWHVAPPLFRDRNGFCLVRRRLEAGTFRLAESPPEGATHVTLDAAALLLLLESIELAGATRRKRYWREAA